MSRSVKNKTLAITAAGIAVAWFGTAWAQVAPPPIIVPQVQPQLNSPGPQLKIPQSGNPLQQRTIKPGSTYVRTLDRRRHHAVKNHGANRKSRSNKRQEDSSSAKTSGTEKPQTGKRGQKEGQTTGDKKLKELDDALSKKMQGICRGC